MIVQPVILCGGSGTRLWPLSREQYPKQLLRLCGDHSMLQATALRLNNLPLTDGARLVPPILVGNEEYRFLMAQQLQAVGVRHAPLILEPCGRNTAPAVTLAAMHALGEGDDPVLVVMPADHVIQDVDAFLGAVAEGVRLAAGGRLVTLGVRATSPETGYGYIQVGEALAEGAGFAVAKFVEKPDALTAAAYLQDGGYLWNAGIFVFKASVWLENIRLCRPDIAEAVEVAYAGRLLDVDFMRPAKADFERSPSDSIDYAVLERLAGSGEDSGAVAVVPLNARWSDLGAWSALWEIGEKDGQHNVLMGDVLAVDTHDTLAVSEGRLVACVGLEGMVVVETPDAVLVADKAKIQSVKELVALLKGSQRSETQSHRKVYRPWGWYDSVDRGQRFQVKHIVVAPGAALSLQMHHHRAEHWVVVSGTARVTRGEEVLMVTENQSTYIPLGTVHRLENPGKVPLEIIEIQSGSYLGEDDIVRFNDNYGRSGT
ncbi:mannose-1-phosphate guanylyltransferase/mannose-6-phosphate isomerase [Azospira restricta]|uniref:mannose-1-phosphate guanylyltransferase n=1 Tax=Azospira restricta TaxID=404405 RepID=A0A974SPJ6_9RHOO|nr:mannose-1-phosphate guanylyltransferase/mannose-6-phosphate isomerase [Azospira restricta]QRJ64075.1 mannose-1-phosphate guanylyltransferase/mannose-6-phosphate isomerase [Azospira restricta]